MGWFSPFDDDLVRAAAAALAASTGMEIAYSMVGNEGQEAIIDMITDSDGWSDGGEAAVNGGGAYDALASCLASDEYEMAVEEILSEAADAMDSIGETVDDI